MISHRTTTYKKLYQLLPDVIKKKARKSYKLWSVDPNHPSLKFKEIYKDVWSVRIGYSYRSVGVKPNNDTIIWFWVGSHEEYNKLLKHLANISKGFIIK
jgi:hypothetical protein